MRPWHKRCPPLVAALCSFPLVPVAARGAPARPGGRCRSAPRRRWVWRRWPLRPRPPVRPGCGGRWGCPPWPIGGPSAPLVVSPAVFAYDLRGFLVVGRPGAVRSLRAVGLGVGGRWGCPPRSDTALRSRTAPGRPSWLGDCGRGIAFSPCSAFLPPAMPPTVPPVKGHDERPTVGLWAALDG